MPEIPQFDISESPVVRRQGEVFDPSAGAAPGNALAAGMREFGGVAQQWNNQELEARRQAQVADASATGFQRIDDVEFNASKIPDREQAMAAFGDQAGKIRDDILNGIDDPTSRARVQERLDQRIIAGHMQTGIAAFGLQSSDRQALLADHLNQYSHQLATAQTDDERDLVTQAAKDEIDSTVGAHWIAPAAGEQHWLEFQTKAAQVQAGQDILADPAAAAKKLADPANYSMLDPLTRNILTAKAERAASENDLTFKADVANRFQDNLASIQNTGFPAVPLSAGEIQTAFPHDADRRLAQLSEAHSVYTATSQVALTSPDEDRALIARFTPSGAGYAMQDSAQKAVINAVQGKYAALASDPAGYVLNASPKIAALFDAGTKDPTQLPAATTALDTIYDKLRVPEWARSVLPASAADAQVRQLLSVPAPQRAGTLATMAQTYGDAWPRVMGDLVKAKLPAEYEVLAALPSSSAQIALADAIGGGKVKIRDSIAPEDAKTVDNAIDNSADLRALDQSFAGMSGGAAKSVQLRQAVKLLGYRFAASGDPAGAAAQAVAAVTSDKYDFFDQDGGIARVPKGKLGEVENAASGLLANLKPDQLAPPPVLTQTKLTPQELQGVALSAAQRGRWATNESDNGLFRLDVNGRPVMLSNGKRLELKFSQLDQIKTSYPPPDNNAAWANSPVITP